MFIVNVINFLLSVSATVVFSISPFFITEDLKLSKGTLMIIESCNELFSNIGKILSGVIIDRFRRIRKLFIVSVLLALLSKLFLFHKSAVAFVISNEKFFVLMFCNSFHRAKDKAFLDFLSLLSFFQRYSTSRDFSLNQRLLKLPFLSYNPL